MKKLSHFSVSLLLLISLVSCSTIPNKKFERSPSGVFDSCKSLVGNFFNQDSAKVKKEVATDNSLASDRDYVINNHKKNTFTTGRGLNHYRSSFARPGYPNLTFSKDLERIKNNPNAHWLDAGGGMGFATEQAMTPDTRFKSTLISVETPAVDLLDSTNHEIRRKVISGRFIEDIPDDEILKSDIITDMYGPMAYSSHPAQVLQKYINNLKQDGVLYIHLGDDLDTFGIYNQIITPDGRLLNMSEWLESIPGLKVEIVKVNGLLPDTTIIGPEKSRIAKIQLVSKAKEIEIQELERMSFSEGGALDGFIVPRVVFKAKTQMKKPDQPNNQNVKNSLRSTITNFRTGEYEHLLFDNLSGVGPQEWAHFSNQEINWAGLKDIDITDDSHYTSNKVIAKAKSLSSKNVHPLTTETSSLGAEKTFKLISDHNGTFNQETSPDQMLLKYLNALHDKGKIVLFLGDDKLDLSKLKILSRKGGHITLKSWLQKIPGIKVTFKTSKETLSIKGKKLKVDSGNTTLNPNGPTEEFVDRKVIYNEVVQIEITDRSKINIPSLELIGIAPVNDRGFQVPIYLAD
jgi:hypothetical protein